MILNNKNWKTNKIRSTAKSDLLFLWVFAIAWNAVVIFTIVFAGDKVLEAFKESPIFYIFLSFPLIGIFMLYKIIKDSSVWNHYGKTPLVLETFPGEIGGVVSGYLDLPINYNPAHQAKVSLNCLRYYIDKNRNSDNSSAVDVKWQDIVTLRTQSTIDGSRIRFHFTPPADLPESLPKGDETIEWNIHVELPKSVNESSNSVRLRNNRLSKNKEFSRKFIIPVLKSSQENLLKPQTTLSVEPVTALQSKRVAKSIITTDSDIPRIRTSTNGTEYYYPPLRSKVAGIFFAGFGIALVAFSWMLLTNMAGFVPVTSMIIGIFVGILAILLFGLGIFIISSSLRINVSSQGIKIEQKIFGFSLNDIVEKEDIADIIIKKGMSSSTSEKVQVWYDIRTIDTQGKETTVGDNLEGSSYAESIRQKIIADLGSWSPVEFKQSNNSFIDNKLSQNKKLSQPVAVLRKITPFIIPAALAYDAKDFILPIINNFI